MSTTKKAAQEFTARFMALVAQRGPRKELRAAVAADIERSLESKLGRQMLQSLVDNYLRGQAPHFAADAEMVFALNAPRRKPEAPAPLPEARECALVARGGRIH